MTIQNTPDFIKKNAAALALALELAELGIPVFPVRDDKRPACPHGFKDATNDAEAVKLLWKLYPAPLVGVPTGEWSGLDALDVDPRHCGDKWLAEYAAKIPATRIHGTRSGGWHFLFKHHTGLRNSAGRIADGVDVRADGGYLIWWPLAGFPVLSDAPFASWPDWLISLALPPPPPPRPAYVFPQKESCGNFGIAYAQAALRRATDNVAYAQQGQRNNTLNCEMFSMLRFAENGALDAKKITETLAGAALVAGLNRAEIIGTIASALRARGIA